MPFDVFISHSSADKQAADATCAALESAGVRCWIAPRDVRAGREYAEEIIGAIDSSRIMVLVFSTSANDSGQVRREIERAVSKGLTIITLRIEDVTPTKSMEYYLDSIHWLDAITPPLTEHLNHLVAQVQANLNVDTAPDVSGSATAPARNGPTKRRTFSASVPRMPLLAAGAAVLLVAVAGAGLLALRNVVDTNGPITKLDGTFIGTYKTTQLSSPRQIFAQLIQTGESIVGTFETTSMVYGTSTGRMISKLEGTMDHVELQSPQCSGSYRGTFLIAGTSISFTITGSDCLGPSTSTGSLFRSPVAKDVFEAFRQWRTAYLLRKDGKMDEAYATMQQSISIMKAVAQKDQNNPMWEQDLSEQGGVVGGVADDFLSAKKFTQALSASELGISLSPDALWIYVLKACSLMLLDRPDEARSIFLKYADRQNVVDDKSWQTVVLEEFQDLRGAGLTAPLMNEIQAQFGGG